MDKTSQHLRPTRRDVDTRPVSDVPPRSGSRRWAGLWRSVRFYEKKRGEHRTGSTKRGTATLAAFFTACFIIGCAVFGHMAVRWLLPVWRANHDFVETTCVVVEKRLAAPRGHQTYQPQVLVSYQVQGKQFRQWTYDIAVKRGEPYTGDASEAEAALVPFHTGSEYPCWYDPVNPTTVVVLRQQNWLGWLMLLLPVSLITLGVGGTAYLIVNWGMSAERIAATGRPPSGTLFALPVEKTAFPYVPNASDLINSPGTVLAYRLPVAAAAMWPLMSAVVLSTIWNGVVAMFVARAVASYASGSPDWSLTLPLLPFLVLGIAGAVLVVRRLVRVITIGVMIVEISGHPLYPGHVYDLNIRRVGRMILRHVRVLLVCEESTTFRQGTDSCTHVRRVFNLPVCEHCLSRQQPGGQVELGAQLGVPPWAMHSFRADHNQISWKVVVVGNLMGRPAFRREFPVVIFPPASRRGDRQ